MKSILSVTENEREERERRGREKERERGEGGREKERERRGRERKREREREERKGEYRNTLLTRLLQFYTTNKVSLNCCNSPTVLEFTWKKRMRIARITVVMNVAAPASVLHAHMRIIACIYVCVCVHPCVNIGMHINMQSRANIHNNIYK